MLEQKVTLYEQKGYIQTPAAGTTSFKAAAARGVHIT